MSEARIICADVVDGLRQLEAESVQCVVTSPPYWGLRDYSVDGQLGLERTPEDYVERLVGIFRKVRRVLRPDGTAWLNLGDSYTSGGRDNYGTFTPESKQATHPAIKDTPRAAQPPGLKPKDLIGIPWRVAFALQADGWWLRSAVVWAKPNPMPESMNGWRWERCRVKVRGMWEDAEHPAEVKRIPNSGGVPLISTEWADCPGCPKCGPNDGLVLRKGSWRPTSSYEFVFLLAKTADYFCDAEAVREDAVNLKMPGWNMTDTRDTRGEQSGGNSGLRDLRRQYKIDGLPGGRNLRNVWTIPTAPFLEAHFATFPPKLPELCIRAGTSEKGCCSECGAPLVRVVERANGYGKKRCQINDEGAQIHPVGVTHDLDGPPRKTLGFRPFCSCGADPIPATVLDPFCGAGTTGLVALRLGRRFIGIDLSPEYCEMADQRVRDDAPLFNSVETG